MSILDEIFAYKKIEVARHKLQAPLPEMRRAAESTRAAPDFVSALRVRSKYKPALIAEVKKASPSRGVLAPSFDPLWLAQVYVESGAAAISVLTDECYFQGHLDHLRHIHAAFPQTPLLRKDFLIDEYQVYEARAAGASAILLIVAALSASQLADLHHLSLSLGLSTLVEVHTRKELEQALKLEKLQLLGVNNRDLHTFEVNLQTCLDLRPLVPGDVCFVGESGIHTAQDVRRLRQAAVDGMLVGEALVTARDPSQAIQALLA